MLGFKVECELLHTPFENSVFSLQIHAPSKPKNMALNDPEVVEVAPAMFSIPTVSLQRITRYYRSMLNLVP